MGCRRAQLPLASSFPIWELNIRFKDSRILTCEHCIFWAWSAPGRQTSHLSSRRVLPPSADWFVPLHIFHHQQKLIGDLREAGEVTELSVCRPLAPHLLSSVSWRSWHRPRQHNPLQHRTEREVLVRRPDSRRIEVAGGSDWRWTIWDVKTSKILTSYQKHSLAWLGK